MQLSVIILNYNVRYFLEACIKSVQAAIAEIDAEIIVVDNDSPDDSCEMVKMLFPDIKLIENTENVGFAKANNQAIREAKGSYICILNPDTIVAEDTFVKLLMFSKEKENLGIVGCKLIDGTGAFLPESKRNLPTPKVSIKKILGSKQSGYYAEHVQENQTGKVDILVGAFMWMQKTVYEKVQGFDEDYFMYGEDIDLSYKVLKAGFDNYYFGETTIIHYKGESTLKNKIYAKRFYGAMQLFYKKHFRKNILFDIAVSLGTKLIPLIKKSSSKMTKNVDKIILISDTTESIQLPNKKVTREKTIHDVIEQYGTEISQKQIEIIFDNNALAFKEIIAGFEKQLGYYKILPKNSTFILGSDSAETRGEVLLLKEN